MEIFLIRHAQTQGNIERRYIGRIDQPLSQAGVACFCNLAYPMAQRVYVSPLLRCRQTAQILYPGEQPVVLDSLRECDFGDFEGKCHRELEALPEYQEWIASGGEAAPPNGESGRGFRERCCNGFAQAIEDCFRDQISRVAFVIHGGTIMAVMERFAKGKPFYDWQVPNLGGWSACVTEEQWAKGRMLQEVTRIDEPV